MIDDTHAGEILTEMVQIGRTFRIAGVRRGQSSLTGTRFGFLKHLSAGDARPSELAQRLLVSVPVGSRAIDSLEADGLVERRVDPADARAYLISITDLGRETLAEAKNRMIHRFADALSAWSPEDAAQAIHILQKLNAHLSDVINPSDAAETEPSQGADADTTKPNHESEIHG